MKKSTSKATKILTAYFVVTFFSAFFPAGSSGIERNEVKFNGDIMSVQLEEVSLKLVLKKIKRAKGVWFNENESLLDRKVSVYFNNLQVEKGLRRILFGYNYALFFDPQQRLVGIIVLNHKNHDEPLKSDMINLNKSLDNKNEARNAKASKVFSLPETGEEAAGVPEDPKGRAIFPPSPELFSERHGDAFSRFPENIEDRGMFPPSPESFSERRKGNFSQFPED